MVDGGAVRLLIVAGTMPEAIKLAPVLLAAARRPGIDCRLLATGQHGAAFDEAFAGFGLAADIWLPAIAPDPSPDVMADRTEAALAPMLIALRPDMVIVQGDTTSAYAGARAAARIGIPVAHVEAGLRSGDPMRPWPEERNRIAIDALATLLLAPTPRAAANLAREPAVRGAIAITGNSGIDALLATAARIGSVAANPRHRILLTCHRRESIGEGIVAICAAVLAIAARGDVEILCPVHPNPAVEAIMHTMLGHHHAITLVGRLPHRETVAAMLTSRLILTDSGGIQEEAATLGVPTLVLRDVTERQEGLASGNLALVGTDSARIVAAATRLLDDDAAHAAMTIRSFPFGAGGAADHILDAIERHAPARAAREASLRFEHDRIKDGARQGV